MKELKKLFALMAALIIAMSVVACGGGDDDDDDDSTSGAACSGCDEACIQEQLAAGNLGAIEGDAEVTVETLLDACVAESDAAKQCVGYAGLTMVGGLKLVDEVDKILGLVGGLGLKSGELVPQQMNVGDIIGGFIDPIYAAITMIDTNAEATWSNSCELTVDGGVPLELGSSPSGLIYLRSTINGTFGEVEARLLGGAVDSLQAVLDFLLAHDLNFDLTSAISQFSEVNTDALPSNLPAMLMSAQWLFADNPDFLNIADAEQFGGIPALVVEAINEIVPVFSGGDGTSGVAFGYSADHVLSLDDANGNGVIDAGDTVNVQLTLTEDFGDTAAGPIDGLMLPDCSDPEDICITDEVQPELVRIFDEVIKPALSSDSATTCGGDSSTCLKLTELNTIGEAVGLLDDPLPPVVEIDLAAFFIDPKGLRGILLSGSGDTPLVIEGELSSDSFADCDAVTDEILALGCGDYNSVGDVGHFGSIDADGLMPMVTTDVTDYVLPYMQLGSCTINGALWTNLAGFDGYPSQTGIDYSAGEADTWDNGTNCDYNLNKLLAVVMLETGLLGGGGL